MTGPPGIPPDFGGFIGYWFGSKAVLSRYGHGKPIEGVTMTPLNLVQARKLLDDLIEIGMREGRITAEHLDQARRLPSSQGLDEIPDRKRVDEIAGED